jgi:predicted phage tail protein
MPAKPKGCSCLFLPVTATRKLLGLLLKSVGRLVLIVAGFGLMIGGVVVSLTVVGACFGVPLMALGLSLILRGLF